MGYVFLGLAIIACVAGSSALTASDGMKSRKYGAIGVLVFAISYVLLSTNDLDDYEAVFRAQMEETREKMLYYQNRLDSLKGWYALLCEGKRVRMVGKDNITPDDQDEYVTEILLPVNCDSEAFNYLSEA